MFYKGWQNYGRILSNIQYDNKDITIKIMTIGEEGGKGDTSILKITF